MNRRAFIKGTTIGTVSMAAGALSAESFIGTDYLSSTSERPLSPYKVAHWHANMFGFIEQNGLLRDIPTMPEEPEWRLVEVGQMKWTMTMPYPKLLAKDLMHLEIDFSERAYGYSIVDTSLGRLRADYFFKDTLNMTRMVHLNRGKFLIVELDGKSLGYWGYTSRPNNYSLNFTGLPLGDKIIQVWTPDASKTDSDSGIFKILEKT